MEFIMKKTLLLSLLSIIAINGLATSQARAFDWIKYTKPVAHLAVGTGFGALSFLATRVALYTGIRQTFPDKKLHGGAATALFALNAYVLGKLAAENFGFFKNGVKELLK